MNKILIVIFLCLCQIIYSQEKFHHYFKDKTLRIDFTLGGNDTVQMVMLQQIKKEPYWGGSHTNLIDTFEQGDFRYRIFDADSRELIFSKGFNSLFREWQTTEEAKQLNRSLYHVNIIPFPKKKVVYEVQSRNKSGIFETLISVKINPKNYFINDERIKFEVTEIRKQKLPKNAIDIVFLAEGYTASQMDKYIADVNRFTNYILDIEPFKSYSNSFNFYAIKTLSDEEGTDIPGDYIYKKTAFGSTFYTFDSPRYLTVTDIKKMYDAAANVPYDHIYVLVNTDIYGGGAFFNHYTCCAVDNELSEIISTHELAHGLIGLADEYFNTDDDIEYFYDFSVEPWEANITTLANFEKKWAHLVEKSTPIPTPRTLKYDKKIGAFEGGAYSPKNIYSPMQDCKMKSNNMLKLCPVCKIACMKIISSLIK